jgi:hypothetical protein
VTVKRPDLALVAVLVASLGGAVTALPPSARADAVDEAIQRFEERVSAGDTNAKRNAIAELGLKKDPRVAKALMTLLLKDKDEDVRIAVCQVIGEQKDPSVAGRLYAMFEDKKNRDNHKLLAALLEGVGEANAKGMYKDLLDAGKKWQVKKGEVAEAAYRAIANHHTRQTVDDLVKQLQAVANPTGDNSVETQNAYNYVKPAIMDILQKLTKQNIKDPVSWKKWWGDNEKTYKPEEAEKPKDLNASMEYFDEGYRFTLRKPSKDWSFKKGSGDAHHLTLEALEEGAPAAWVELIIYEAKRMKSQTPEAMAEENKTSLEETTKDIKDAEWAKKTTCGGEKAIEQTLTGRHKDHQAVYIHNIFLERGGILFLFRGFHKSGKDPNFKKHIDDIYKSLKFSK